jgi:hypothetical protein
VDLFDSAIFDEVIFDTGAPAVTTSPGGGGKPRIRPVPVAPVDDDEEAALIVALLRHRLRV